MNSTEHEPMTECPHCHGTGEYLLDHPILGSEFTKCPDCYGTGILHQEEEESIVQRLSKLRDHIANMDSASPDAALLTVAIATIDSLTRQIEAGKAGIEEMKAATREAFLNMIADAKVWKENVDGDEVNGRAVIYVDYDINVGHEQLSALCETIGIKEDFTVFSLFEAINRAVETDPSPPQATQEVSTDEK